jgi:hypothetical protein
MIPRVRWGRCGSQSLIAQSGVSVHLAASLLGRLGRAQKAEDASTLSISAQVSDVLKFKGDVFVARGADHGTVSGAVFLEEDIVAHDSFATDWHPDVRDFRSICIHEPPVRVRLRELYTEKERPEGGRMRAKGFAELGRTE